MRSNNHSDACTCHHHTTLLALLDIFSAPEKSGKIPEEWNPYMPLLEEPERTWLRDHDIHNLSYEVIARKYKRSVGTIKSSVWRGRRLLLILIIRQQLLSQEQIDTN